MDEVVLFRSPLDSCQLTVLYAPPTMTEQELFDVASECGLVYQVRVKPIPKYESATYVFIKYYLESETINAKKALQGRKLGVGERPLKVSIYKRTRPQNTDPHDYALNSNQCVDLANYLFGYNGWAIAILALAPHDPLETRVKIPSVLPPDEGLDTVVNEEPYLGGPMSQIEDVRARIRASRNRSKPRYPPRAQGSGAPLPVGGAWVYSCVCLLTVRQQLRYIGVGLGVSCSTDVNSEGAQKRAVTNAYVAAFRNLVVVKLANGKICVRHTHEGMSAKESDQL